MQEYHLVERQHNQSIQVEDHYSTTEQNFSSDIAMYSTNSSDIITQRQANIIKELQDTNDQTRKELANVKFEQIQLKLDFESSTKQFTSVVEMQQNQLRDHENALEQYKLLSSQQASCLKQFCHSTNWEDLLLGLEYRDFHQIEIVLQERDLRKQICKLLKASNTTIERKEQETQTLNQSIDTHNIVLGYQFELVKLCQSLHTMENQINEQQQLKSFTFPQDLESQNQLEFIHNDEVQYKFTQPSLITNKQENQSDLQSQNQHVQPHKEQVGTNSDIPILLGNLIDIYHKYIKMISINKDEEVKTHSCMDVVHESTQVQTEEVLLKSEQQLIINPLVYQELEQEKQKCAFVQKQTSLLEQNNILLVKENQELLSKYLSQTQKVFALDQLLEIIKGDLKSIKKQNQSLLELHSIELQKDIIKESRTIQCLQQHSKLQDELSELQNVTQENQYTMQQLSEKVVNYLNKTKIMQNQLIEKNAQIATLQSDLTDFKLRYATDGKLLFEQQQLIIKLQANQHNARTDQLENPIVSVNQYDYFQPEDTNEQIIQHNEKPNNNEEKGHLIKYEALQIQYNIMCQRNQVLSKQILKLQQMLQKSDLC